MAQYTEGNHEEIPDPTPVEMPIGYEHPESLESMIARLVHNESRRAKSQGQESFEESDDFDMDDDSEIISEYQMTDMQEEYVTKPDGSARVAPGPTETAEKPSETPPKVAEKAPTVATEAPVTSPAQ